MIRLVNLTFHEVTLYVDGAPAITWPTEPPPARLVEVVREVPSVLTAGGPVPVRAMRYSDTVEGLPAPADGVGFIVSRVLAAAVRRDDLYFPWGDVRNDAGQIIGCRALAQVDHVGSGAG